MESSFATSARNAGISRFPTEGDKVVSVGSSERGPRYPGLVFLGVGVEIAFLVLAGALGGLWLDDRWDTGPAGLIVGALGGTAAGFLLLVRTAKKFF